MVASIIESRRPGNRLHSKVSTWRSTSLAAPERSMSLSATEGAVALR
jgi:hypothetical protein